MQNKRLKIKRIIYVAAAVCLAVVLVGLAVYWYKTYHVPMQRARPILNKLDPKDANVKNIGKASLLIYGLRRNPEGEGYIEDKSLKPLQGIAAEKVKNRLLEILDDAPERDRKVNLIILGLVWSSVHGPPVTWETGLDFEGEEEWEIIREAAEFYNEKVGRYKPNFHVEKDENGKFTMRMSGPTSI